MALLKTCCCGCTLRTGTLIIGSLSLLEYFIIFIRNSIVWIIALEARGEQASVKIHLGCYSLDGLVAIIVAIFLIIGTVKGRRWFLMPWIAYGPFRSLTDNSIQFEFMNYFFEISGNWPGWLIFLVILALIMIVALQTYFAIIVISHFNELTQKEANQGTNLGVVYSSLVTDPDRFITPNDTDS